MDLFSTRRNCAEDHINLRRDKNKKPRRGEVFCSVFLRLVAASTLYYVNEKSIRDRGRRRNFHDGFC
ncbi:hypothetical protein HMPREF1502_0799 [Klebsiella sp. AS10]|nr:hypothetical protein CSC12_3652 [Klebsiella michiganensis]EUB37469.1 hypothetical protein HMPREF1502_0799 [Klebsiella sp. AS10]